MPAVVGAIGGRRYRKGCQRLLFDSRSWNAGRYGEALCHFASVENFERTHQVRVRFYRAIERVRDAARDAVLEPWVKRAPHDPTAQQATNVRAVAWQALGGRSPQLPRRELDTDQSDHLGDCAHVLFHFRYARLVLTAEVAKMLPPRRDVPIARRCNNELRVLSYLGPKLWSGRQAHSRT